MYISYIIKLCIYIYICMCIYIYTQGTLLFCLCLEDPTMVTKCFCKAESDTMDTVPEKANHNQE